MPNRLLGESSPYLLQHAHNPVDWFPWGPEAFARARERRVPILLSIGYSTCHWCHVMERESFSDPAVAELMNRSFVCVKLDREERPDVDRVYMAAVQALTGQGGWPLNCFLTPELKPFYGGTYFPPEPRWGQAGWPELLRRVASLWESRRADIEADAGRLTEAVSSYLAAAAGAGERGRPGPETLAAAEKALLEAYDEGRGGFGGAPKFPQPGYISFLLRRGGRPGGEAARRAAAETLAAMAGGGVFDQAGGGLHRYSTDDEWRLPHFEKMLYDNAQFLENLGEALSGAADPRLSRALASCAAYLDRDLSHPEGGFYSAEDADSAREPGGEKSEGAFYLWTKEELERRLGGEAAAFCERFGVLPEGNAPHDPHGELGAGNILREARPAALPEGRAAACLEALRLARAARPRPALDDKILCSWNGLALTGLSRAHAASGEAAHLERARRAAEFLRKRLSSGEGGRSLVHSWRDGRCGPPGMADDYAFLSRGLLDLYEEGFDPEHLSWSLALAEEALRRFALPEGGLRLTAEGDFPELIARVEDDPDGVEPSAAAALAQAALRLEALCGRADLGSFARRTLERLGPSLMTRPLSRAHLLCALDLSLAAPRVLVLAGLERPGGAALRQAARSGFRPGLVRAAFTEETRPALEKLVPAVSAMPRSGRAAAYLCAGGACGLPIEDPAALARRLDA